ncbi:MAG: hypothetical protein OXB93_03920, partial [Cytophagales bacterium]|nr:hypothetical protein [Cytophagales bacterium]
KIFDMGNQDLFVPINRSIDTRLQSSTKSTQIAQRFSSVYKPDERNFGVIVQIRNDKGIIGMDIGEFGQLQGVESEVLFGDHTRFQLTGVREKGDRIILSVKQLEN